MLGDDRAGPPGRRRRWVYLATVGDLGSWLDSAPEIDVASSRRWRPCRGVIDDRHGATAPAGYGATSSLGFIDEFSPLYAVLTVYFAENGLDAGQIATLFALWAGAGIVFEVPSGALADRVDRRVLLAVSFVLRAVGISIWLIDPSFEMVLAGACLWALHSALASGAFEAMIHDQLAAVGAADRYQATMGRIHQASVAGIASGSLLGAGLLALDVSFEMLGWFTVLTHAGSIAAVLTLPKAGAIEDDPEGLTFASWWRTLRDGLRRAGTSRGAPAPRAGRAARGHVSDGRVRAAGRRCPGRRRLDDRDPLLRDPARTDPRRRARRAGRASLRSVIGLILAGVPRSPSARCSRRRPGAGRHRRRLCRPRGGVGRERRPDPGPDRRRHPGDGDQRAFARRRPQRAWRPSPPSAHSPPAPIRPGMLVLGGVLVVIGAVVAMSRIIPSPAAGAAPTG